MALFQFNSRILVVDCVVGICNNGVFLEFHEFEMKYRAGVWTALSYNIYWNIICWITLFEHARWLQYDMLASIWKTVLSVSCNRFKSHICKSRPPPPLRPRNYCIYPCLCRSTQMSILCLFSSRRQAEWTPVQASCFIYLDCCITFATCAGLRTEARWVRVDMNCIHWDCVAMPL